MNAYGYWKAMGRIEELEYALRTFTLNAQAQSLIHKKLAELEEKCRSFRAPLPKFVPPDPTAIQIQERIERALRRETLEARIEQAKKQKETQ